ncbi:LuxR C-terminal-related transcriptional regulator [Paenibacillus rigui]|uniref:LuxR family transcriptional regulator n=1 Tax=Paenibacillus rigui TaxID=554312 RepID=A0A229UGC5_9BACL|nr:LuxR C-terminal-related transcriptional regulator [Paenibacillus rigui]OXM82395.1 LuxR family transcriptional regulator [Paenibacillus rigui]
MIQRSEPIVLRTKITLPSPKSNWVDRRRLIEQLEAAASGKLTTLCAPAGSGKTTLLTQWLHACGRRSAWYALDAKDNDPIRFWRYVSHALTEALPLPVSGQLLQLIQSLPNLSFLTYLDAFMNELAALEEPFVLLLDDYQFITDSRIHESIAYFIEYMPQSFHLVLSSRAELPFSTVKWLSQQQCVELDAQQLQFTRDETQSYYRDTAQLSLSPENVDKLVHHTEGWVTGLQLVSLSLRTRTDKDQFIEHFAGNHRNIADYLFHEVLSRLPQDMTDFIMQTSLLDRMDAALCDAVTQQPHSQSMLEKLKAWNIFIVPLDDQNRWFRYHHLFSQFVRSQVERAGIDRLAQLRRRISECCAGYGMIDEAIEHAIGAKDTALTDRLLAQYLPTLLARGEFTSLLRWFEGIPSAEAARPPELMLLHCFVVLVTANLDRAEALMGLIEHKFAAMEPSERKKQLQSGMLFVKSNLVFYSGDFEAWYRFSEGIMERFLPESPLFYGINYNRTEPAVRRTEFGLKGVLSMDTETIGLQFTRVLESKGWKDALITLYMNQALGEGYYEWNRLEDSLALLQKVEGSQAAQQTPGLWVPNQLLRARLYWAAGQAELAHVTLEHTLQTLAAQKQPEAYWGQYVQASQIRLLLRAGELSQAKRLVHALGVSFKDKPTLYREYVYVTLARLLGAQRKEAEALRLLELLKPQAIRERLIGSQMEIALLQSLLEAQRGQRSASFGYLHEALRIGEANGYIRSFLDEGEPAGELLRRYRNDRMRLTGSVRESEGAYEPGTADRDGVSLAYVDRLLLLFPGKAPLSAAAQTPQLIEPLTRAEIALIQLLTQGASNKEIAGELSLSVGTVKVYLSRIYAKLGVTSRTQALIAVRERGLVDSAE